MDFQRLLLFTALSFTLFMIYDAWQNDYVRPKVDPTQQSRTATGSSVPTPALTTPSGGDLPHEAALNRPADQPLTQTTTLQSGERIAVETDLYHLEIDTLGGDLRQLDLKHYPVSLDDPNHLTRLLSDQNPLFVAQSGLLAAATHTAPDHYARYQTTQHQYTLAEGHDELVVPLTWSDGNGVTITKSYHFNRDSYLITVRFAIDNRSGSSWSGHYYQQLQRQRPLDSGNAFIYTYTGGVIYSPAEKYEKVSFEDMDKLALQRTIQGGWLAMIQHYFLSAWLPTADSSLNYYTKKTADARYVLGAVAAQPTVVAAGSQTQLSSRLFIGPKLTHQLEAAAEGLELTVDYGMLTVLAKPLFWVLEQIHALIGNWGWSIVWITILLKLAFYKLSEAGYRSMAQMRKFQPKLMAMKERYGEDRGAMNEAMMKLYREEKINPLGGCLPILVQIPVFIALYWMLLESVEMRQAPFMLWIHDLSAADPYFVLPLLMGVTMLIQQRLNPAPLDPIQAKVMMALPIVFTVFFIFFPAGLVIYWVVNNTLSIAQQWYITHVVLGEKKH